MLKILKDILAKQYSHPSKIFVISLIIIVFLMGYIFRGCLTPSHMNNEPKTMAEQTPPQKQIWTCSMHPQIKQPEPGKCPLCGMDLIPMPTMETMDHDIHSDKQMMDDNTLITLSPKAQKLIEAQISPVERKPVSFELRLFGKIKYDETSVSYITAWMPGRIDRLFIDYTGKVVKKGDPMVLLYSPELVTSQSELIQAKMTLQKISDSQDFKYTAMQTVEAAREKLRLWGLTEKQIHNIEKSGKTTDKVTIYAPMSGTVIKKEAIEGMYVQTGTKIYTMADLSNIWVMLDAYETDIPWLLKGQKVKISTEAYPGEIFEGKISFIDPFLNKKTRTVKVRVNVSNPKRKLKPDMFAHAFISVSVSAHGKVLTGSDMPDLPLVIPASAPLITGKRAVVYVKVPNKKGVYEGREVVLGPRAGNYYVVLKGLSQDEMVVTNGNFRIDSAMQVLGKPSMMSHGNGKVMEGHQNH